MELKFGILHDVHLAPQPEGTRSATSSRGRIRNVLSHSSLLLSAINDDPAHTPLASAETQAPFREYVPAAQSTQSLDVPPVHVLHDGEQGVQFVPSENAPGGQSVPEDVILGGGLHLVRSFASCVKPVLHAVHTPVPSVHAVQPIWQTISAISKQDQMK
jgi:hypothetical protein